MLNYRSKGWIKYQLIPFFSIDDIPKRLADEFISKLKAATDSRTKLDLTVVEGTLKGDSPIQNYIPDLADLLLIGANLMMAQRVFFIKIAY